MSDKREITVRTAVAVDKDGTCSAAGWGDRSKLSDKADDKVISLNSRKHDADGVLADLTRILKEEPDCAADGVVVIMLSRGATGDAYDIRQLASDMRHMELVALLEFAKLDNLRQVMG